MFILQVALFVTLIGSLRSHQTNKDIKRLTELTKALQVSNSHNYQEHSSILETNNIHKSNDYDDHSSGLAEPRKPIHFRHTTSPYDYEKMPVKIYQPREDPRLFYQSDAYIKEINNENVNYEVASIYPGREIVRAQDVLKQLPFNRFKIREQNRINYKELKPCVKCPHNRTLIAKAGSDRVILQSPRLFSCSGSKLDKDYYFIHMYGPKLGSLLYEGTHLIIGRIMHKNDKLQVCKMQIHVMIQTCRTPKSLVSHCIDRNQPCNFTCRDRKLDISGPTSLTCGDDLQWEGKLPTCGVRRWCQSPPPPEKGRISCTGKQVGNALFGLAEGSKCRVRCKHGWRGSNRTVAVCRRGIWTHNLICRPRNSGM